MTGAFFISALAFLGGIGFGTLYFALLRRAAQHLTSGGSGWLFAAHLVLRLGVVFAGLALLLWAGAGALAILAAGLGFAMARLLATQPARIPRRKE